MIYEQLHPDLFSFLTEKVKEQSLTCLIFEYSDYIYDDYFVENSWNKIKCNKMIELERKQNIYYTHLRNNDTKKLVEIFGRQSKKSKNKWKKFNMHRELATMDKMDLYSRQKIYFDKYFFIIKNPKLICKVEYDNKSNRIVHFDFYTMNNFKKNGFLECFHLCKFFKWWNKTSSFKFNNITEFKKYYKETGLLTEIYIQKHSSSMKKFIYIEIENL